MHGIAWHWHFTCASWLLLLPLVVVAAQAAELARNFSFLPKWLAVHEHLTSYEKKPVGINDRPFLK